MEERQFTPEEAQKIVEISLRLQSQWNENVSLAEIEQSAAECGVDPRFVRLAVQEVQAPPAETKRRPTSVGKEHIFIAVYSAIFALVTWAFAVFVATSYQPLRFQDFGPLLLMAPIFGMVSQARRKPWLALVPFVITFSMSIAALIFSYWARRPQLRGPQTLIEGMGSLIICEAMAIALGYGLARLIEALRPPSQRSFTN